VWQWVGIFVFIVASYLLAASAKNSYSNFSYKTVFLLVGSFLANGTTMLCQKMLTFTNPNGNISLFSLFSFAIPAIIFALSLPFGKKENKQEKLNSKIYLPILLLAIALFIINQFATAATKYVSSAVLFALINGGNTIIAAVIAAIFYREKPTWRSITGLVLGLASLMLVNIKL